ncbi:hypothetical protein ACJRO7_007203 [Eucalyptus globulus]|uniref:Uncharacterized protein n=1 Tax=Eucalyptus globulus TaxID=34317 RepID=A0ABD3INS6_EUCGL
MELSHARPPFATKHLRLCLLLSEPNQNHLLLHLPSVPNDRPIPACVADFCSVLCSDPLSGSFAQSSPSPSSGGHSPLRSLARSMGSSACHSSTRGPEHVFVKPGHEEAERRGGVRHR